VKFEVFEICIGGTLYSPTLLSCCQFTFI